MSLWIIVAFVAAVLYFVNLHFHSYWSSRGIPYKKSQFLLGELYGVIFGKQSFGEFFYKIYQNYKKNKIVGLYFLYQPSLLVADPLLVQDVLIKNFTSFHDRGFPVNEDVDPLSAHLFSISGQKWRNLRVKLSPTFTSGKLKGMFPTIRDCGQILQDYIYKNVKNGVDVFDIRELLAKFTTSVISSVAFGIENDCINEPENIFRKMGQKFFEPSLSQMIGDILTLFMPSLFIRFQMKITPDDVEKFFMNVVRQTIEYREKNKGYERKDFMQLLIQLKNQGFITTEKSDTADENRLSDDKTIDTTKLTFNELAAQAFVFFIAGFETSSSTSNFCLFELSKHPQIQQKVQDEIDKVIRSSNSREISYDMLSEMKYLDCCIDETLRKYPILAMLNRECTKKHTFAGTNWTIEKGTMIFIPVLGLHRDPEIYDNPLEFRPERFLDSQTGNGRSEGVFYIPFGDGPRNCIGARMGKLQTKLVLAMTLSKFTFELSDEKLKKNEIEFYPAQFILTPKDNIMLKAKLRQ